MFQLLRLTSFLFSGVTGNSGTCEQSGADPIHQRCPALPQVLALLLRRSIWCPVGSVQVFGVKLYFQSLQNIFKAFWKGFWNSWLDTRCHRTKVMVSVFHSGHFCAEFFHAPCSSPATWTFSSSPRLCTLHIVGALNCPVESDGRRFSSAVNWSTQTQTAQTGSRNPRDSNTTKVPHDKI